MMIIKLFKCLMCETEYLPQEGCCPKCRIKSHSELWKDVEPEKYFNKEKK